MVLAKSSQLKLIKNYQTTVTSVRLLRQVYINPMEFNFLVLYKLCLLKFKRMALLIKIRQEMIQGLHEFAVYIRWVPLAQCSWCPRVKNMW